MKIRLLALFSALTLSAFAAVPQVTYSNLPDFINQGTPSVNIMAQTFTGFDLISVVSWNTGPTGPGTADFNLYIAQWDVGTNKAVGPIVQFGSTAVGLDESSMAAGFNGNWTTATPEATYVLLLTSFNTVGSLAFVNTSVDIPSDDFFGSGQGFTLAGAFDGLDQGVFDTLVSTSTFSAIGGLDFNLSVTGALAPVPEPKAAATGLAALFVAGLMCRRQVWQNRRAALAA